ncbi:DoxX family protein [Chitinophaga sp.]|uniref:DoxX family protein n=1 Tax=Chitinophaga sp. TaxID=1869181 RepID=UPI0031DC552D
MKKTKIIFWVSTVFIFLFEGIMPLSTLLFTPAYAYVGTRPLGYPDYFAISLIIMKFSGALAILLPAIPARLKEWAYAGLTFNLLFAVISHIVVDGNIAFILTPVVVMIILALSYFSSGKMQMAYSKQKQDARVLQGSIA